MASTRPPSNSLLAEVAEHRAGGLPWPVVAQRVGRPLETIRVWPRKYRDRWDAAFRIAERRLVFDRTATSAAVLHNCLGSNNERNRIAAAKGLLHFRIAYDRVDLKLPPPNFIIQQITSDILYVKTLFEGHSHAEIEAYLANLRAAQVYPAAGGGHPDGLAIAD